MMKRTKTTAAFLLALLLAVCAAQTASACNAQSKQATILVTLGTERPVTGSEIAEHTPVCQYSGLGTRLLIGYISSPPDPSIATVALEADGSIKITGRALGNTNMGVAVECLDDNVEISVSFTVTVTSAPTITTASLPDGTVGVHYSQTLAATGTTPIAWVVPWGSLPDGLTLDTNTGVISGTPTVAGSFSFGVAAENAYGSPPARPFTIDIQPAGVTPPTPRPASGSSGETPPPKQPDYEKATIGRCKEWVNVRSGPGPKNKILGKAYLGEEIELLQWDRNEAWCKVIYNNGNNAGWVEGKFIIPEK